MVTLNGVDNWPATVVFWTFLLGGWVLWVVDSLRRFERLDRARAETEACKAELRRIASYWVEGKAIYEDNDRIIIVDLHQFDGVVDEQPRERVSVPEVFRRAFGGEE